MTAVTAPTTLGLGSRVTTLARAALASLVVVVSIATDMRVTVIPAGIDVMIPLAAAERWLSGGMVYVPDGFRDPSVLPPFLYPPFVLPLVAPLTLLPEELVRAAMMLVGLVAAVGIARRLSFAWLAIPFLLLWEPMFGAIWGGNVQLLLVGAFVATFWQASARHDLRPEPREIDREGVVTPRVGWYAATVASVKATQLQPWLAIARRSPRSAVLGVVPWAAVVLVTLPLVGVGAYVAWVGQLGGASDPSWAAMGPSLLRYLPSLALVGLTAGTFVVSWWARGRDVGAWIGLMMLIVAPNMHDYQALFLLPAMLRIRREFALLAALTIATATQQGWWLGIGIVAGAMLVGLRWPVFYEPGPAPGRTPG